MAEIKALLLGAYLPICVLSGAAVWMLLQRLVLPAARSGRMDAARIAIGLGALFAMGAHAVENLGYGVGRWVSHMQWLLIEPRFALAGKVLILAAVIFTLGGLSRAETNAAHLWRITALTAALWAVGTVAARMWAA